MVRARGVSADPLPALLVLAGRKAIQRLRAGPGGVAGRAATDLAKTIFVAAVTLLSLANMALTQQNPFIYFRF